MNLEAIKCLKHKNGHTEQKNTCPNSLIETLEQGGKYVQK